MSKFFEIVKRGALYAVIISFLIYLVLGLSSIANVGMPWHRFLTIVVYGILISSSEWLNTILKLHPALKLAINFAINLAGFTAVYLIVTGVDNFNTSRFLVLIGLFTVCYALVLLITKLFKRGFGIFSKKESDDKVAAPKKEEPIYRPRYSDED